MNLTEKQKQFIRDKMRETERTIEVLKNKLQDRKLDYVMWEELKKKIDREEKVGDKK